MRISTVLLGAGMAFFGCGEPADWQADDAEGEAGAAEVETAEQGVCTYPMVVTFGVNDAFSTVTADPVPYMPAMPEFVNYLATLGIGAGSLVTFDSNVSNRHFVATLRHGMRACFGPGHTLTASIRARALLGGSSNDSVTFYNTDFGVYSFPVVTSVAIVPTLIGAWNPPTTATLNVNLTPFMAAIGDMLQVRIQDDTMVDYITFTLN